MTIGHTSSFLGCAAPPGCGLQFAAGACIIHPSAGTAFFLGYGLVDSNQMIQEGLSEGPPQRGGGQSGLRAGRHQRQCDNGTCRLYNLDLPDVIAVRDQLLPAGEREENILCDLSDTAWFQRIDASGGAVFFAAGVFYYFLKEQVRTLVRQMADAFPGSVLVFDAANGKAVRLMLKTWIKDAAIQNVGAYFAVADARRELSAWDSRLRVSSRGYMLGYNDLKDPSVSGFFRFLARVGDNRMNMQIVKLGFGDGR